MSAEIHKLVSKRAMAGGAEARGVGKGGKSLLPAQRGSVSVGESSSSKQPKCCN